MHRCMCGAARCIIRLRMMMNVHVCGNVVSTYLTLMTRLDAILGSMHANRPSNATKSNQHSSIDLQW
jgi:hypothetical protein